MSWLSIRFVISITVASVISLALFYLMQYMISGSGQHVEKPQNYRVVDFVRLLREPEDTRSQPRKKIPPRKPTLSPSPPTFAEMKLAKGQPPATAVFSDPRTAPAETMRLAKPDPLNELVSRVIARENPAHNDNVKAPPKPQAIQNPTAIPSTVAKASPADRKIPKSIQDRPHQKPFTGKALNPTGEIQALLGDRVDSDAEAVPVFKIEPIYPRKAAKNRIEGWVKVEFVITEKGTVANAVVVDSRPRRTFDRSAIQSIRKWRFRPKIINGKPVQRKARQVIKFKLAKG